MPRYVTDRARVALMQRMRRFRTMYRLTQLQAAALAGCEPSQWARWERGEVFPIGPTIGALYRLTASDPTGGEIAPSYREPRV
jgi:transcriptional regulator with XRE-family HTH domain